MPDQLSSLGGHSISSEDILQNRFVQTQVSDQPLELGIPLLKVLESADLRESHRAKLFLPSIERLLRDPQPPTYLRNRLVGRFLRQGVRDQLF